MDTITKENRRNCIANCAVKIAKECADMRDFIDKHSEEDKTNLRNWYAIRQAKREYDYTMQVLSPKSLLNITDNGECSDNIAELRKIYTDFYEELDASIRIERRQGMAGGSLIETMARTKLFLSNISKHLFKLETALHNSGGKK